MGEFLIRRILEMSLIGSYCILLLLPVRWLLKKCERKYIYYLWFVGFLNLMVPFTLQGRVSLIPKQVAGFSITQQIEKAEPVLRERQEAFPDKQDSLTKHEAGQQLIDSGKEGTRSSQLTEGSKKFQVYVMGIWKNAAFGAGVLWQKQADMILIIWLMGLSAILLFHAVYVPRLKKQISPDKWTYWDSEKRIAEVEGLSSPFLWGIVHPVIFLPANLDDQERKYIIAHENVHRKRKDSIVKMVFFLITAVHWFNPVVWMAWALFCRDMEVSCDEEVLAKTREDIKKQYAQSLLKYAAAQNGYLMVPLTFGEPSVKTRIKSVLRFRKGNALMTGVMGVVVALVAMGLIVRPIEAEGISMRGEQGGFPGKEIYSIAPIPLEAFQGKADAEGSYEIQHRDGYVEASVTHIPCEDDYFTPGLRTEEELDALAQQALRELYDLTGFQVEYCVYQCTDFGCFYFARTPADLKHDRTFYGRSFGEKEGYDIIPSMDIVSTRRCWYSDVEQLDVPKNVKTMEDGELAAWFLRHSAVYQGEALSGMTEQGYAEEVVRVFAVDGSLYEVTLDRKIDAVSHIYGPYPAGFEH